MRHALIAGVVLLFAAPQFARADDTPEWKTCISVTNSGAERLPACTAVIEGKTETGRKALELSPGLKPAVEALKQLGAS